MEIEGKQYEYSSKTAGACDISEKQLVSGLSNAKLSEEKTKLLANLIVRGTLWLHEYVEQK